MSDLLQDHIHSPDPYEDDDGPPPASRAKIQFQRELATLPMAAQEQMLNPASLAGTGIQFMLDPFANGSFFSAPPPPEDGPVQFSGKKGPDLLQPIDASPFKEMATICMAINPELIGDYQKDLEAWTAMAGVPGAKPGAAAKALANILKKVNPETVGLYGPMLDAWAAQATGTELSGTFPLLAEALKLVNPEMMPLYGPLLDQWALGVKVDAGAIAAAPPEPLDYGGALVALDKVQGGAPSYLLGLGQVLKKANSEMANAIDVWVMSEAPPEELGPILKQFSPDPSTFGPMLDEWINGGADPMALIVLIGKMFPDLGPDLGLLEQHVLLSQSVAGPAALDPVQAKGGVNDTAAIHAAAAEGTKGGGGSVPYKDRIQSSFGKYDISGVKAYTGSQAAAANRSMGSLAYATGDKVAFKGSPDLHTAAHEVAHVVQQAAGVSLPGGVGSVGDKYEKHADAVAERVVSGQSAEGLLDSMTGGGSAAGVQKMVQQSRERAVQRAQDPSVSSSDDGAAPDGASASEEEEEELQLGSGEEEEEALQLGSGEEEEEALQLGSGEEEEEALQLGSGEEEEEAVQAKSIGPVQFAGTTGSSSSSSSSSSGTSAQSSGASQALKDAMAAMRTAAQSAADTAAAQNVRSLARAAKAKADAEASTGGSQVTTMKTEAEAVIASAEAARLFFTKMKGFRNALRHQSAANVWKPEAETALAEAKTKLPAMDGVAKPLLTQATADLELLKAAEDAQKKGNDEKAKLSSDPNKFVQAYNAARSEVGKLSAPFKKAYDRISGELDTLKFDAVTELKNATNDKMALVSAGEVRGLEGTDGSFLTSRLFALEQLGEAAHPDKAKVDKINTACFVRDFLRENIATMTVVTGATIKSAMDTLQPKLDDTKDAFPTLIPIYDAVVKGHLEPELKKTLTQKLSESVPENGPSHTVTQTLVTELETLVSDAESQAAMGRITIDLSIEKTRVTQAKAVLQVNADYTALVVLPELASEMGKKADEDLVDFRAGVVKAAGSFKDKANTVVDGFKAVPAAFDSSTGGQGAVISEERKEKAQADIIAAAGQATAILSLSGWAEAAVDATLEAVDATSAEERGENRNTTMEATGQAIQAGANYFSVIATLAQFAGIPDIVSPTANGIGKFLQKKGEGYDAGEATAFALAEFGSGLAGALPVVGPFFKAAELVTSSADAAGAMAGLRSLEKEREILDGDLKQLEDLTKQIEDLDSRWRQQKFAAPESFTKLMSDTAERLLEVKEKLRVAGVKEEAMGGD